MFGLAFVHSGKPSDICHTVGIESAQYLGGHWKFKGLLIGTVLVTHIECRLLTGINAGLSFRRFDDCEIYVWGPGWKDRSAAMTCARSSSAS